MTRQIITIVHYKNHSIIKTHFKYICYRYNNNIWRRIYILYVKGLYAKMKKNTSNEMYSFLSLSISNFFIVIIRYVYTNCHGIGTKWIRFFVIVSRLLRISQRCDKIFQKCANRRYHNVKSKFSHVVCSNSTSKWSQKDFTNSLWPF